MYKFLKAEEYRANYQTKHPHARHSPDGETVVISTNHHGTECGCVSHAEALAITRHWVTEETPHTPTP